MEKYFCKTCGCQAGYDGRCGDGPYQVCGCGEIVTEAELPASIKRKLAREKKARADKRKKKK